jgi:hypothetical protein
MGVMEAVPPVSMMMLPTLHCCNQHKCLNTALACWVKCCVLLLHVRASCCAVLMISLLPGHAGEPGKCSYRTYICCGGSFNAFLWLAMLFSACLLIAMGLLNVNTYIISRLAQQAALMAEGVAVSNANAMQQLSQQVDSIETSLAAAPTGIKGATWFVDASTAVDKIQGEQPAVPYMDTQYNTAAELPNFPASLHPALS